MEIEGELKEAVAGVLNTLWDIRAGNVVPDVEGVKLSGGGVRLDVAMLYADLRRSSRLASDFHTQTAAKIFKAFLECATKIIRSRNGQIRSFDGDRVMGVFSGNTKEMAAALCALEINYAVRCIIIPQIKQYFKSFGKRPFFRLGHGTGVDTGEVLVVRAGQRNSNDLVWVGKPPNFAAELSSVRKQPWNSYISKDVFDSLESNFSGMRKSAVWKLGAFSWLGKKEFVYRSCLLIKPGSVEFYKPRSDFGDRVIPIRGGWYQGLRCRERP